MAMHDPIGTSKDPHMKNPTPKYILIAIIVILLAIFVAPKIYEIYKNNIDETSGRAEEGQQTSNTIRDK